MRVIIFRLDRFVCPTSGTSKFASGCRVTDSKHCTCRSMNGDPDVYGPDAHEFKPERHLDENGQLKPSPVDTKDEGHVSYGFGRR